MKRTAVVLALGMIALASLPGPKIQAADADKPSLERQFRELPMDAKRLEAFV